MEPASKRHRSGSSTEDDTAMFTPAWEGVAAESMFQLFRELNQQVKALAPCDAPLCVSNCRSFSEEQESFLKLVQGNCASYDPALDIAALKTWEDRVQMIDVSSLHFTRSAISKRFLHGPHKGELVSDLKKQLRMNRVQSKDITPLVVMKWDLRYWVICGNRRLKAMKEYAPSMLPIKVRCIVHEPCAESAPVVAAFLRTWDTTKHTEPAEVDTTPGGALSPTLDEVCSDATAVRCTGLPEKPNRGISEIEYSTLQSAQKVERTKVANLSLEAEDCCRLACAPDGDELHIMYHIGRRGEYGQELLEFEIRPDGLLRYASDSCLRKVRKQCYISPFMLAELERIVADSGIQHPNHGGWPPAADSDRQELEIVHGSSHFVFSTCRVETPHEASGFEGMLAYFYLVADLEAFVFSVVRLHFGRDALSQ